MGMSRRVWVIVGVLAWLSPPLGAEELPHEKYTVQTKSATSTSIVSDTVLWTPASGERIVVMGCAVSSGGAQQTLLEISDAPILPMIYTAADTVFQAAPSEFPLKVGSADQTVTYTTTSPTTTTIVCTGYEF